MTDQPGERRTAPRVAATFRIKLGYSDIKAFIDGYAANISKGGIFVPTRQPREKGTEVRFELVLKDGSTGISGVGRIAWTRPFDAAKPNDRYGMGLQFVTLDGTGEEVVRQALEWRARHLAADKAKREIADEVVEPAGKPAAKPVEARPAARPIEARPAARPIEARPAARPVEAKPGARPALTKPGPKPSVASAVALFKKPIAAPKPQAARVSPTPSKPTEPETKPAEPEIKPTEPETKPAEPEIKPTEPETRPTEAEPKPAEPETKSQAEPAAAEPAPLPASLAAAPVVPVSAPTEGDRPKTSPDAGQGVPAVEAAGGATGGAVREVLPGWDDDGAAPTLATDQASRAAGDLAAELLQPAAGGAMVVEASDDLDVDSLPPGPPSPPPNNFDISVDEQPAESAPPPPVAPDAAPPPPVAPGAAPPQAAPAGAVPLTFEEALRQRLAEESAPDDAYDGVWQPGESVASDSEQEILDRLMRQSVVPETPPTELTATNGPPAPAAPREEKKGGFFGKLFGRKKK